MAFDMSYDSSLGHSFELEDSNDLETSLNGFASVLGNSSTKKNNAPDDDPWAMNLQIPTNKTTKKKNKKKKSYDNNSNTNSDATDNVPAWMRSSKEKSNKPKKKIKKESALDRADKYLKKVKKDKKAKSRQPIRAEPETVDDMEFSSDEEDRRRRKKKKEKKSMRVNMPRASSGLSPISDKGTTSDPGNSPPQSLGNGGGMRRSTAQTNLGQGMGSNTLKRYQEQLDERNTSPIANTNSNNSNTTSPSSPTSPINASSALGNVVSFADMMAADASSAAAASSSSPPTSTDMETETDTKITRNVMSFDAFMAGGEDDSSKVVEEVIMDEVVQDTPVKKNSRATTHKTTKSRVSRNSNNSNNSNNNNNNNNNSNNNNYNNNYNNTNNDNGRPPLHIKTDPLEESIVEIVEEDDALSHSRASSYGSKTPKAPSSRRPSLLQDDDNNGMIRADSVGSYYNDDFEDEEEYSVDFDNQSQSNSSRVSPRAAKMQQQQKSSRRMGSSSNSSTSGRSRTMGTQANGSKEVGCQAMLVPLPPLGFDPMLYFGSPAMMSGMGMNNMRMGSGGMHGGMHGMGMMAPPSYSRMPPPMSFYGGGYRHHPAMEPMYSNNNNRQHAWGSSSKAGSPGSSVAPSVPSTTETKETATDANNEGAEKGFGSQTKSPSSTRGGSSSDMFAQQMEASRVAFQNQLDIIREHIHKTHARVAATAQAAGYQNYTTLAATQDYIAKMRKPMPLSFEEATSINAADLEK